MRDWLTYTLFRIGAAVFGALPESAARSLGIRAGAFASRRKKANRPLLASHMRRVLGSDASESAIQESVDDMYRSYGRYWAETFWFRPQRRDAILNSVERVNFEPVHEAKAAGKGIVFALPHVGNWEIAGVIAEDLDLNLMAVAESLPNPRITDWFLEVRAKFGIDIVLTSDPQRRTKMIRRLDGGGALALLADRDLAGKGIPVDFFGEETTMPAGPTALAELTDSVLIPVVVYFQDGPGYRIEVGVPIEIPSADTRADRVRLGTELVARALESQIRKQPSQWHLFQSNWPSDAERADGGRP